MSTNVYIIVKSIGSICYNNRGWLLLRGSIIAGEMPVLAFCGNHSIIILLLIINTLASNFHYHVKCGIKGHNIF